jgi:hypothetical protein
MASPSYIEALLRGAVPDQERSALKNVFDYLLNNLRFGRPVNQDRCENMQVYFLIGTTPATPNTEFSLVHNLATPPYLAIPVMPLQSVNITNPPLTVTRPADGNRVYFSSPAANASFCVMVEA